MSCNDCNCEYRDIEERVDAIVDDLNYGNQKVLRAKDLNNLIKVLDVLVANAKFMTPEAVQALRELKGEYVY